MNLRSWGIVIVLLWRVVGAAAQEQPTQWRTVLYHPTPDGATAGELVVISEAGLQTQIAIPAAAFEYDRTQLTTLTLVASPDARFLAVIYFIGEGNPAPKAQTRLFDLRTGSEIVWQAGIADLPYLHGAAFSPDSTQLAAEYADDNAGTSGLLILDTATGTLVQQRSTPQVNAMVETDTENDWLQIVRWDTDGLYVVPTCAICAQTEEVPMWVWQPTSDQIQVREHYYIVTGDAIERTGELLRPKRNEAYPVGTVDTNLYPSPYNVIEYFPAGINPQTSGQVVIAAEARYPFSNAIWGLDGNAFFVRQQNAPEGLLIFRDGRQMSVPAPEGPVVALSTPTGWLFVDTQGIARDYRLVGDKVQITPIFTFNFTDAYNISQMISGGIAYAPLIGAGASSDIFPPIPVP